MKYQIKNARIWTADSARPWADTAVFEDGKFTAVGAETETADAAAGAETLDFGSRVVLPAFIDPHIHVTCTARSLWIHIMPKGMQSFSDVLADVAVYAAAHPKEEVPFIYATSCPRIWLRDKTKADVDRVVSDRPVLICDDGYHSCLVNSKMLELLGVDASTPYDHTNVRNYERDENGDPTGIVLEHAYEERIERMYEAIGWAPPAEDDPAVLVPYFNQLTKWGLVTAQDGFTESEKVIARLKEMDDRRELHMIYCANVPFFHTEDFEKAVADCHAWAKKYGSQHIVCDTVKFFLDGTNEIGTAASMEAFKNDPAGTNFGILNMQEDELVHDLLRLNEEGLNIQIHLVGDRAFHVAVNAVERAKKTCEEEGKLFGVRVNLLHCECTLPEDRKRAADLGIMINITPHWNGGIFGPGAYDYYGKERFETFYSFNDFIRYGANVSVSSDTVDKEDMPRANPFVGMQIGMTRHDDDADYSTFPAGLEIDETGHTIRGPKAERLSLSDLLLGYTIRAAKACGLADRLGSITPGKDADFIVLDRDVFRLSPYAVAETEVAETWFEGERIY